MVSDIPKGYSKEEPGTMINIRARNFLVFIKLETISVFVKVKGLVWETFFYHGKTIKGKRKGVG